ncbi:MAG TPA: hypothetical protein GX014_09920 [Firmicutes bacterium]|jgi:hypothetical protein|nr:hypothetical protein [Bacillota bacterium]
MNVMFESGQFFVRIQNKGGYPKITIWNSRGDKIFSDIPGPDPALQFWNTVESLTDSTVTAQIREQARKALT